MKKNDLKTGMICVTENGKTGIVVGDSVCGYFGGMNLKSFNDDLTRTIRKGDDIIEVYAIPETLSGGGLRFWLGEVDGEGKPNFKKKTILIWKRNSIPEYTMEELISRLGHEFKIKK